GGPGEGPFRGLHCLAAVDLRPHLLSHRVPQPRHCDDGMGLFLLDLWTRSPAHRQRLAGGRRTRRRHRLGRCRAKGHGRMSIMSADVKRWASELEFLACGVTDLAPNAYAAELDAWLAAGRGGTMRYINRQAKKRKDP